MATPERAFCVDTGESFRSPGCVDTTDGDKEQFLATTDLLDAAINSLNSLNSLVKKDSYRSKIASFNNPTSTEMGFSLELEIQTALKPLLQKARNTNTSKFSDIVSSLIGSPSRIQFSNPAYSTSGVFSSIISLVGTLVVNERNVTRQDLDSFMLSVSKYFVLYERLKDANRGFDQNIGKFDLRVQDVQFDIRELIFDLVMILHPGTNRSDLKDKTLEGLYLTYLDTDMAIGIFAKNASRFRYPADGIKTCKEIVYGIQKLFAEYQKIYSENYNEVKTILQTSKTLGQSVNTKRVDVSLGELQKLFSETREADVIILRLNTLNERLKSLVAAEQLPALK